MSDLARILVVDDDEDTLRGTVRLLEKAGYIVDGASTGEEGLEKVLQIQPDLLLLDHDLPGINGAEVCRRIKMDPVLADIIVVIISASHIASDEQAQGLEGGADGYIGRPIANRELLARVGAFVRIQNITKSLRLQTEELQKSKEASRQAYLASLNLMEDAVAARERADQLSRVLKESEEKLHLILNSVAEGIYGVDMSGNCIFCNDSCLRLLGYKHPDELLGKNMHWQIHSKHPDGSPYPIEECRLFQAFKKGENVHFDDEVLWRADGTSFPAEFWSHPQRQDGVITGTVITFLDITARERAENYREMSNEILQILSKQGTLHDLLQRVLTILKTRTGFDAVGIRLRNKDDFPYFAQNGFSNEFLLMENTLVERGADGGVCRDKDGNISLECTCGLVISGKTDPANQLFTKGGSFWTNDSFPILDLTSDQDPRLHPRNTCIHQNYASVALVPIRTKDQIIGLMQFNDRRKNCFSLDAIEQFEDIAANIGEALLRLDAEEALRKSEIFLNTLINSIPIPVFYKDRDGRYIGFNIAYETFFGATKEKLIGKTVFDISPQEFAKIYYDKDNELFESGGEQHYESQVKNFLGETRDVIFSKAVFTDNQGAVIGLIGAIQDITERKRTEEQIRHLATHDLLTDLPSLRLAKDRMSVALNMARRYKKAVALMFVDLDGFKAVNDTLGHDAGDYVLKQVAQRLLSCVRDTDTVARIGGDEFLIVATEIIVPENVSQIAEKVIQSVSSPFIFNGQRASIGASIGIALFPDHGENMDQLIKEADKAMYRIKNSTKNGFSFADSSQEELSKSGKTI